MGEAAAREMRRAARKLIGDQGVQIIERHSAVLNEHATSVSGLMSTMTAHNGRIRTLEEAQREFVGRTLRARLRWLLTGK